MGRTGDARGRRGEEAAAQALARAGLTVLGRNVRVQQGELDLVALDGAELVFVEVKTRTLGVGGIGDCEAAALDAVAAGGRKMARVALAAERWALERGYADRPWRLDVIVVCLDRAGRLVHLEHFRNAVF